MEVSFKEWTPFYQVKHGGFPIFSFHSMSFFGGGNSNIFLLLNPDLGFHDPILTSIFFQMVGEKTTNYSIFIYRCWNPRYPKNISLKWPYKWVTEGFFLWHHFLSKSGTLGCHVPRHGELCPRDLGRLGVFFSNKKWWLRWFRVHHKNQPLH